MAASKAKAAKARVASSTDILRALTAEGVPFAASFAQFADDLVTELAGLVDGAPTRASVAAALSDDTFTATRLRESSPEALGLLEILVDIGGGGWMHDVLALARERMKLSEERTIDAAHHLIGWGFAIGLAHGSDGSMTRLSLIDLCAPEIARRVRGLSLPTSEPTLEVAPRASTEERDRLAVIASTLHISVRRTTDGGANRTTSKKLAARLGLDEPEVYRLLDDGFGSDALVDYDGVVVPVPERLLELARGERAPRRRTDVEQLRALVPDDRWIAREALVRHVAKALTRHGPGGRAALARCEQLVAAALPTLETTTHDGHLFVRRAPPAPRSGGDGHVTPSFEIMLGPAAELELTATLALAAEPVRVDRVLTLKLTPASVAAAVSAGIGVESIERALERVGKHPVPENVRASIRDFARAARTVTIQQVWALTASSPEAADAIARALGDDVVSRPSPTVLCVDALTEERTVRTLLHKASVRVVDRPPSSPAHRVAPAPPSAMRVTADPALRERYEKARRDGFPEHEPRVALDEGAVPTPLEVLELLTKEPRAKAPEVQQLLRAARALWSTAIADFREWLTALPPFDAREAMAIAAIDPLALLPWTSLEPNLRWRVLRGAADIVALIETSHSLASTPTALSPNGAEVMRLATRSAVVMRYLASDTRHPGRAPLEPTPGQRPRPADVPSQAPDAIERAFRDAAERRVPLWLRVTSKTQGELLVSVLPERVLVRGTEKTLLGVEPDTEENRSYPLANVIGTLPAPSA